MTEQNKSIKIFSCDHRKIDEWNLPFIRVGTGFNNNSAIKDSTEENILKQYDKLFSEGTSMWWIWKHLSDFGGADYIGFCHYRRFLTVLKPNYGVFPICIAPTSKLAELKQYILTPEQQLNILQTYKADGLMPIAFPDYGYYEKCNSVQELMFEESNRPDIQLNMPKELCYKAFDILLNNTPDKYKDNMKLTFSDLAGYHFNLFTLSNELFQLYNEIVWKSCFDIESFALQNKYANLHQRWIAYLLERYTSCIIKMFKLNGAKILDIPMLMLEQEEYK